MIRINKLQAMMLLDEIINVKQLRLLTVGADELSYDIGAREIAVGAEVGNQMILDFLAKIFSDFKDIRKRLFPEAEELAGQTVEECMTDIYFKKLETLCRENNIKIKIEKSPNCVGIYFYERLKRLVVFSNASQLDFREAVLSLKNMVPTSISN